MTPSDDLHALRQELQDLYRQLDGFQRRLAALEEQERAPVKTAASEEVERAVRPSAVPPSQPAPPPLPKPPAASPVAPAVPPREELPVGGKPLIAYRAEKHEAAPARPPVEFDVYAARLLRRMIAALGPKEKMSWEMALGTYCLPRIGMVVLAVGVVWLATLAIQRWGQAWMPHFRVTIGYAICAALLIVGKRLEKRAPTYARVLLSGGIGLSYFVTYSTYYVSYTQVIPKRGITLILLSILVAVWFAVAQRRRSALVAMAVTLLGHLTVAISTLTLPAPSPHAILGMIALSLGSAVFLVWNRWYYVAAAGLAGSYANTALWLSLREPTGRPLDLAGGLAVLSVFFLTYALAELFAPEHIRRRAVPMPLRNLYASANSGAFFLLGLALMNAFSFSRDQKHWLCFGLGIVLLAFAWAYRHRGRIRIGRDEEAKQADALFNLYLTKSMAVIALGLAYYFDGPMLTASLAVQAVLLLIAARQSGLVATRLLAHTAFGLAVAHGLYSAGRSESIAYAAEGYLSNAMPAVLAVAALLFLSQLYQRTDWRPRSPDTAPFNADWRRILWDYDLINEAPLPGLKKPLAGLAFPFLYALGAAILFLAYATGLIASVHRGPAASLAALGLVALGICFGAKPYTGVSLALSAAAGFWWWIESISGGVLPYSDPAYPRAILHAALTLMPFLVLSELSRLIQNGTRDLWLVWNRPRDTTSPLLPLWRHLAPSLDVSTAPILPFVYALAVVPLYVLAVRYLTASGDRVFALSLATLAATAYAASAGARAMGLGALILVAVAATLGTPEMLGAPRPVLAWMGCAALAVAALFSERRYLGPRPGLVYHQAVRAPYLLYGVTAWLLGCYIYTDLDPLYNALGLTIAAVTAAQFMNLLHPRALALCGVGLLVWAGGAWYGWRPGFGWPLWHGLGLGIAALALAGDRYLYWQRAFTRLIPGSILVVTGWLVLLAYAWELAHPEWHFFWWAGIAFGLLAYGLAFRSRTAVIVSLIGAMATTAFLVHTSYAQTIALTPLLFGYGAVILFWLVWERLYAMAASRFAFPLPPQAKTALDGVLVAVPSVLLVVFLHRIPLLRDFYLTIGWTVGAVGLFGIALLTHQKYYRYAGLSVFALALARAFLIDTRKLEAVFRIAGVLVLGSVLLAVAYGYIYARNRMSQRNTPVAPEKAVPPGDEEREP